MTIHRIKCCAPTDCPEHVVHPDAPPVGQYHASSLCGGSLHEDYDLIARSGFNDVRCVTAGVQAPPAYVTNYILMDAQWTCEHFSGQLWSWAGRFGWIPQDFNSQTGEPFGPGYWGAFVVDQSETCQANMGGFTECPMPLDPTQAFTCLTQILCGRHESLPAYALSMNFAIGNGQFPLTTSYSAVVMDADIPESHQGYPCPQSAVWAFDGFTPGTNWTAVEAISYQWITPPPP